MPEETPVPDYYAVLGLPRNASEPEIRAAYIRLVRLCHPDRLGTSPDPLAWKAANNQLAQFNEAFSVLGDPVRRKQYDNRRIPKGAAPAGPEPASPSSEEQLFVIVLGRLMPERNVVIKALFADKVITGYHSYINHCVLCTSRHTATDISDSIVKHFGKVGNPVFLVTVVSGEIKGRLSIGAWEFIRRSTTADVRGWK